MKVAFVHDWFTIPAGAEKVAQEIIDVIQPHAIFSLFNFMEINALQQITQGREVATTFLQKIPKADIHYRYLLPLYPRAVQRIDLSEFDVIISSSWMVAKSVKKLPGQRHICYCHTPMRLAWGLEEVYLEKYGLNGGLKRWIAKKLIKRMKNWDRKNADEIDYFLANSHFVAERILKAYNRASTVIYPPINTKKFRLQTAKHDFFFCASRFVDYKNIDLIIEAFSKLPNHKLVIAGKGPLEKILRKKATANVRFLGWVDESTLVYYMQRAKAYINASIEDFGIAGLEAQSCGTPVIALSAGGYMETVVEGHTGLFFHREHPEALADAILRFEKMEFDPYVVRKNALAFDTEVFREQVLNFFLDKCFERERTLV